MPASKGIGQEVPSRKSKIIKWFKKAKNIVKEMIKCFGKYI